MDNIANSYVDAELTFVRAKVKWFNNPKGFGFVVPEGENIDAFLHITTLQRAGFASIGEGTELMCHIKRGLKGALVTEITEILGNMSDLENSSSIYSPRADNSDEMETSRGTVKWYKPDRGYGFIVPEDGSLDVFVHKACLDKKGIGSLDSGQKIVMTVRTVPKGREVMDLYLV